MDDAQITAFSTLQALLDTCAIALGALDEPPSSSSLPASVSRELIHEDFMTLLTLIYTSVTKVALTLRPGEAAYSAALVPLRDLISDVLKLSTCTTLFDSFGATLSEDVRRVARGVFEALRGLAENFLSADGQEYLARTAAVHDLIDVARRELPSDNLSAVKKRWSDDKKLLDDILNEIDGMIVGGEFELENEEDEDEDVDDEWDELFAGSGKKMTAIQVNRAKQIQPLLRFCTLLHKRVSIDILSPASKVPAPSPSSSTPALDALPAHSHELLLAEEEIVAVLYAAQSASLVAAAVTDLAQAVANLQRTLTDKNLLPPIKEDKVGELAEGLGAMSVDETSGGAKKKEERNARKWFDTCFTQIDKVSKSIASELVASTEEA